MRRAARAVTLEPRVLSWLGQVLPGQTVTSATLLSGGYSNENILVTTSSGRYVLRRYRRGSGLAAARTCAVEAALAARLAGAAVPVPEVIAADAAAAAGEPLLLARHVAGILVSEAIAGDAGSATVIGEAAGRVLAAVGSVRFSRGGMFTGPDLVPSAAGVPGNLPEFVDDCLRTGNAAHALSPAEIGRLKLLAAEAGPLAAAAAGSSQLVHADYNAKNLLAVRRSGRWSVTAVLDWEFAFSGSPLVDIGNMLRFSDRYPPGFAGGFIASYREAGGLLPAGWRKISEALDLYALADFLTRPPGHPYFAKAVSLIRSRLARAGDG
jgi:aminoglycoside phosphotransferase (APT) family kinase protein